MDEFRQRNTENVENTLKKIIDEKPENAKYADVIEHYNMKADGFLGGVSCWTSLNCRYTNENREIVKEIEIKEHGSRSSADALNYLLYWKGLYKCNDDEFKQIRGEYERKVDAGIIYPIRNLQSPKSAFQRICKYIIRENSESVPVTLTFICDYDYAETGDIRGGLSDLGKREYSIRGKIEYKGEEYTTRIMNYTHVHILFSKVHKELTDNGIPVVVCHDMDDSDADFMMKFHSDVGGLVW